MHNNFLQFDVPAHFGQHHPETVPDTLDLSDRANLAINGIGGTIDPDLLTMWGIIHYTTPKPHLSHWASAETLVDPKLAESLSLMRVMSGSTQYLDLERQYRAAILSRLDDGLYWDRYTPKRPWRNSYAPAYYGKGKDEDFATLPGAGRMLRTMLIWRELGAEEEYLADEVRKLTAGLLRIAIQGEENGQQFCFYPEKGGWGEPCSYPRSGWLNTDPAKGETEGGEGSIVCMHGHQIYGAARWYEVSRDPLAYQLAEKLTRYVMLPRFWGGVPDPYAERKGTPAHIAPRKPDPAYTAGHELGHWYSHFHARAIALRGILEWAAISGDERAAEFVRRSYEYTQTQGIPRIGWFNTYPGGMDVMESCALGDLVALGIRLSDMGLGDYWEDVDALTRNQLIESQLTRTDSLENVSQASSVQCCTDAYPGQLAYPEDLFTRTLGVYAGFSMPSSLPKPWVMHCCTSNATQGLYYAWEGILRENGDQAEVNLFLNRSGRLLDIDSYLPYEGKVVFRNKGCRWLSIRIPAWVDRSAYAFTINGNRVHPVMVANRAVFTSLSAEDIICLTFPVKQASYTYTIQANSPLEMQYSLTFKGSTLVDISPRENEADGYPIYQRQHMLNGQLPMRNVNRFTPDRIVKSW